MGSELTLRPGRITDREALGRLGTLLVTEHYEFDRLRFLAPGPDTPEGYGQFLVSQVDEPDAVLLVAEIDGNVVGYVFGALEGNNYMLLRGPSGAIYDLVLDPEHRGRGIGSKLLNAALDVLRDKGAPRAVLFTAEKNVGAHRLFERSGFRRTMIEMTRELD